MSEKYNARGTKVDHSKTSRSIVNKLEENKNNLNIQEETSMLKHSEPQHITILSAFSEIKRLYNDYIIK